MKFILAIAMLVLPATYCAGQVSRISVKEWVKKLSDPDDKKNLATSAICDSIENCPDTNCLMAIEQQLPVNGSSPNPYIRIRMNLIWANVYFRYVNLYSSRSGSGTVIEQLIRDAMKEANEMNDEYLIAYTSLHFFLWNKITSNTELAVTYGTYSAELYEKLFGESEFPYYNYLADEMYHIREYGKCKSYCVRFLHIVPAVGNKSQYYRMLTLNVLALAWHRTGEYDSAVHYYNLALAKSAELNNRAYTGFISGNIGQVKYIQRQYDTAITLLEKDYHTSMDYQYFDNAANSLQWVALANAALGKKARALQQVREALRLIELNHSSRDPGYVQNIYNAAVDIYRTNGLADSAVYFSTLYQQAHDSIEKKIATSSLAISNMRLNEEKSRYNIRRMQQEKKSQLQQRNFIITGIALLSVISILIVNWQRVKIKYKQERLELEKRIMATEMAAAKQQMELFTQNIIEKTSLIEKLEGKMKDSNSTAGQQETITALGSLTILTEEDWDKFKMLFEKIYPMFFQRLKTTAPDISLAEQRMAALTRLQLTTRQMASMQGISPDSVHKTRQRLRQRLGVSNEINLEELIVGI